MPAARELLFGRWARELGPRALNARPGAPSDAERRVALAFRAEALGPSERARLAAIPGAALGRFTGAGSGPAGDEWLVCEHGELERAAARDELAACLLAALHAAERAPAEPIFLGVLNATPDSFSDGGRFADPERALEHALRLEAEGAQVVDVGGESTRPGSLPVSVEDELRRVVPVLDRLRGRLRARISIDTTKAEVARAALDRGASIVNDTSAGRADAGLLPLVAERGCEYVLMHMRGSPADMQRAPRYRDPLAEIAAFLRERVAACLQAGIEPSKIVLDPGIGFGKRLEDNLDLLRRLVELRSLGLPLCLGVSRKSFIARAAEVLRAGGEPEGNDRSGGTAAAIALGVAGGAELLRVHDVARAVEAAAVALAVLRRPPLPPASAVELEAFDAAHAAKRLQGCSTTSR